VEANALKMKITIAPNVIFQEVQLGESLLLDVKTLKYFAFDPMGTRFWKAIEECGEADRALQAAATAVGRSAADLQPNFYAILSGLERSGLITLEKST
jgi:hypothetical protein